MYGHIFIKQLGITYYILAKSNQPRQQISLEPSSCFDDYSLTNPLTLANNFTGTKSLLSTPQFLPNLSNEAFAKCGVHQLIHTDSQSVVAGLPVVQKNSTHWSQTLSSTKLSHSNLPTSMTGPTKSASMWPNTYPFL